MRVQAAEAAEGHFAAVLVGVDGLFGQSLRLEALSKRLIRTQGVGVDAERAARVLDTVVVAALEVVGPRDFPFGRGGQRIGAVGSGQVMIAFPNRPCWRRKYRIAAVGVGVVRCDGDGSSILLVGTVPITAQTVHDFGRGDVRLGERRVQLQRLCGRLVGGMR